MMDGSTLPNALCLRLLVVEDEAMIAMMLEDILEDLGHRVVEVATSVQFALREISAKADELDAVILDANLGGDSAGPVAAVLRQARIPFVIASGYEASELQRLGFDEPCIRKPYQREEVSRALERIRGT